MPVRCRLSSDARYRIFCAISSGVPGLPGGIASENFLKCASPPSIHNSDPLTSLSSSTKDTTASATSANVLGLTSETPLDFTFERWPPAPLLSLDRLGSAVPREFELTTFTRMRRSPNSIAHVRPNERMTAVAPAKTKFHDRASLETKDVLQIMEAPFVISGSAFCTMKNSPFT